MRMLGGLLTLIAMVHAPAEAQRTALTVSGFPVAFTTPTAAELTAGSVTSSTATMFVVDATTGTIGNRTTTVWIRCQTPCPASGTKPASTLRWRRADLATWNPITTTDVMVESRVVVYNILIGGSNDPWSNSIYWQFLVDWTNDSPGSNTFNIIMTLTVTYP